MPDERTRQLLARGARIVTPDSVSIDESVDPGRIDPSVTIHPGCRILGESTFIGPNCVLGAEGPLTLDGCQLGRGVRLQGGSIAGATLLDGVSIGPCAHVRPGTLLEERASCAHSVGLKQTLLFPYVTLGSLINFCDAFMAGGTDSRNHSEVGSSYIHFNFTPNQDKATPSMMGDVPRGVLLDQPPIFLGGQGGLVGPCRIEYGTVVAAGVVCRRDVTAPGTLVFERFGRVKGAMPFRQGVYGNIARVIAHNVTYIANLLALHVWYHDVRSRFTGGMDYRRACLDGAMTRIAEMIEERLKRMTELAGKLARSIELAGVATGPLAAPFDMQARLRNEWAAAAVRIESFDPLGWASERRDAFMIAAGLGDRGDGEYLDFVRNLSPRARAAAADWLQGIVDTAAAVWDWRTSEA